MNKKRLILTIAASTAALAAVLWLIFGEKIKVLYTSLNSFKDENLAHTFQHTPEIQPVKKISRGTKVFEFQKQENTALPEQFTFQNTVAATKEFLEDTKATGLLVIQDDTIKYEEYFAGGDEHGIDVCARRRRGGSSDYRQKQMANRARGRED